MRTVSTTVPVAAMTIVWSLAGCVSPAEIHESDAKQCDGFGFARGTDGHAGCMQKIARDRQKQMDAFMSAQPASPPPTRSTTECKDTERSTSTTAGTSTSATTGMPGNSTTTGSSSSTTTSSGSGFSLCVNK